MTEEKGGGLLGVVGGSSFLKSQVLSQFETCRLFTKHGEVQYHRGTKELSNVVFVQRHAANPAVAYSPPHLINKLAIAEAMRMLGCDRVIGFGSTGSLKPKSIPIGTLVVPDDYMNYNSPIITSFQFSGEGHRVPQFDEETRQVLLRELRAGGFSPLDGGVYVQTSGPRFETKAEIQMLTSVGDVLGMTCSHEATLFNELSIPFAVVCMVDNLCNGLQPSNFTVDMFHEGVARNQIVMDKVFTAIVKALAPKASDNNAPSSDIMDTIIKARYVIPVDEGDDQKEARHLVVLEHQSIVVHDGKIVHIGAHSEVAERFQARNVFDLSKHHVVLPGLINCHTHAGMSMLRGFSDDEDLISWLTQHIWPAEAKYVSPDFVKDGCRLAIAEMLRCGTTCFNDMYFFPEATAQAVEECGVRAVVGLPILDFPSNYAKNAEEYFAMGQRTRDKFANSKHRRITFSWSPHAPYTVSDENLERAHRLCKEQKTIMHTHLHETRNEVEDSVSGKQDSLVCHRSSQRMSPLQNFERLGLLDERLVAVHMTQLSEEDIQHISHHKTHVIHCPSSNLKLSAGFCPVFALTQAGVNVAIGTDSCASNNALDMFSEMKSAALLAKALSKVPTAIPASEALRMATINGAKALHLDHVVGSLAIGKHADMIAVDLDNIETMPMFNVVSHIVYCTSRSAVTHVWVDGACLMANRVLTRIDEAHLKKSCQKWQTELLKPAEEAKKHAQA